MARSRMEELEAQFQRALHGKLSTAEKAAMLRDVAAGVRSETDRICREGEAFRRTTLGSAVTRRRRG